MSIQRYIIKAYENGHTINDNGPWVKYADHVAAIEHLERIHQNEINELRWMNGVTRDDSFAAGVQAARDAVAELGCNDQCGCSVTIPNALAAIDALRGDA